ncbi:MAG: hypothetical protein UW80_C0031G0006 [Microgenomates group bacterium GW2011_GWC1_44_9]|nr:MAG: hypothetical protein UW80_C0031G0006 [Microgenomates group bacterium GW2011_GWC1_44_9]
MSNINKKMLSTILGLGVIVAVGYFGPNLVLASENTPAYTNMVSRIAQKFNLKESDVEAVFAAVKDERHAEMKSIREEKLSQAVSDGVITEAQKNNLLSKMEQNETARHEMRAEMQKWFADQGIDHEKLRGYLGHGNRFGPR